MIFEKAFDKAAMDYDQSRPVYPEALYRDIFRYQPVSADSHVLEIGLGTGKASPPVLATGCHFTGIEPGENLIALAKQNLRKYANFSCWNLTLQEFVCPEQSFDLIYAATAFHWIPEEYGYTRVFHMLKSGGVFARFAYHAGPDGTRKALTEQIQVCYQKYMPREGDYKEFSETDAEHLSGLAAEYGFTNTQYSLYHVAKDFTADEYMALLRTYPDHMSLEEDSRGKLFDGIHSAITQNGGTITVYYTMDLELAEKP